MTAIRASLREILRYPSAMIGSMVVVLMVVTAIYAMVTIPYQEAIRQWRGSEEIWYQNPKFAPPAWFNLFSRNKLPVSFSVRTGDGSMTKTVTPGDQDTSTVDITYSYDFSYDGYPQEMILYFSSKFEQKQPFVSVAWIMPDGTKVRIADTAVERKMTFRLSQDPKLQKRLKADTSDLLMKALFSDPKTGSPFKGQYQLVINAVTFEKDSDVNVELVSHGQLYGLAGTDQSRRDLVLPLLWGTPVALAFSQNAPLWPTSGWLPVGSATTSAPALPRISATSLMPTK